jgi:hypothetical protein
MPTSLYLLSSKLPGAPKPPNGPNGGIIPNGGIPNGAPNGGAPNGGGGMPGNGPGGKPPAAPGGNIPSLKKKQKYNNQSAF